ncbi:response regulator transcription factor [Clavibacter michiganensis subsp. phaseoli]|uniref:Response regulator transcription factor n=1 Tax=Clavibacter phaseoli TaxID=1734031 RepID=A0A8I0SDE9_9MICO|nr:response regulator transcription factor [Clavibacter phaseoli]MBF4632600.1 response regulator transcription factor [Clavibacter phaseoli]
MIRVLLVDDQDMIRLGLRAILETRDGIEVVGDESDGLQAVQFVATHPVDVVLMDLRMPGIDGVEATVRIRASHPADDVRIIVLTTFDQDANVLAALRAGADGFLSKGVSPTELDAAIRDVANGGGALSAAAAKAVIGQVSDPRPEVMNAEIASRFASLTPREHDVVLAAMKGASNADIAAALFVSPFTVKTHVNRAMNKVEARDRSQLVAFAFVAGLRP